MTDAAQSPSSQQATLARSSSRLREKSQRMFTLPSRKEALDSMVPDDGTPFKNYADYKPRKLINNFIKERNTYNNPDKIDLFDEFSDDYFINDDSSSDDDSTSEASLPQEGSVLSTSSSDSSDNDCRATAEKPTSQRKGTQRKVSASRRQLPTDDRSDSDEELAKPLKVHKQRLPGDRSSGSETSSGDEFSPVKRKRHVRVSVPSDGSSDSDDEGLPLKSISGPPVEEDSNKHHAVKEEMEESFNQSDVDAEPCAVKEEEEEIFNQNNLDTEHYTIKEEREESFHQNELNPGNSNGIEDGDDSESSFVASSSSSEDNQERESSFHQNELDSGKSNGVEDGDDSESSFIATSSSSEDNLMPDTGSDDSEGSYKPSHEELICNYRQRRRRKKQSQKRRKRIHQTSNSDSSSLSDNGASGVNTNKEYDDCGSGRPASKRAQKLLRKKTAWKTEVLGSYMEEREKKVSKK